MPCILCEAGLLKFACQLGYFHSPCHSADAVYSKAQGVGESSDFVKARVSQSACCTGAHVSHALYVIPVRLIVDKTDCHRSRSHFLTTAAQ